MDYHKLHCGCIVGLIDDKIMDDHIRYALVEVVQANDCQFKNWPHEMNELILITPYSLNKHNRIYPTLAGP